MISDGQLLTGFTFARVLRRNMRLTCTIKTGVEACRYMHRASADSRAEAHVGCHNKPASATACKAMSQYLMQITKHK